MKKIIILVLILLSSLQSCNVLKTHQKSKTNSETKTDRTISEIENRVIYRPKDSVVFVPVPNVVYKDTTIVKRGQTTTLRVNYDGSGTMTKADCYSDEVKEFITMQRIINENIVEYIKAKEVADTKEQKPNYWVFSTLILVILLFALIVKAKF